MDVIISIFSLIILLFSVIIHELAHGYVAYSLGDPTAKYAGRLTLNPIPHLDLFGSIILPLLLFISGSPFMVGWAKPVPTNSYNFRDQKWGSLKVAAAGPVSNIALAVIFGLIFRLVPLPFFAYIVQINIMLALFNLIPIPPLDGHWILFSFLPSGFDQAKNFLRQYGFFLLLFLLVFNGFDWLGTLMQSIFRLITGV